MQFKQTCPTGKLPQKKKNTYTTKATLQHKLWMDMVRGSQDCANHSIILNNDEPRLTLFRITSDMSYEIVEVPDENLDTVGNDSNSFLENPHDSDRNSQDNENSMGESIIVDSADLSQGILSNSILEVPDSVDLLQGNMSYEIVEVPDENPDTVGNDSNSFLENPHDSDRNSQDNENSMAESIIVDSADLSQGTLSNSILEVPDSVDLLQGNMSNSIVEVPDLPNQDCLVVAHREPSDLDPPNVDQVEIQRFGQETYFQLTKCMELTTAAEELTSELCTKFANDPNANYDNINTQYWFDYFIRCKPQKMHLLAIEFITTNKNSASNL